MKVKCIVNLDAGFGIWDSVGLDDYYDWNL